MSDAEGPADAMDQTPEMALNRALARLKEGDNAAKFGKVAIFLLDDEGYGFTVKSIYAGITLSETAALLEFVKYDILKQMHEGPPEEIHPA